MDQLLYAGGLFGLGFATVVFLVSLGTYRSVAGRFLKTAGPFFLFPAGGSLALDTAVA